VCLCIAELVCEDLPKDVCAFSIASSGKRCLLETSVAGDGSVEYQCRTSEVVVERMAEYIETDQCVKACGVDRNSVGISSDALLEPQFTAKLCSPACYQKCPNIVDLYFNLAAGEGKKSQSKFICVCLFKLKGFELKNKEVKNLRLANKIGCGIDFRTVIRLLSPNNMVH
jgi:hypothetical protein